MGFFKKIFKGVGKVFKKIGRGIKKAVGKFGKFMGKAGILGQVAMMFILPGIGQALGSAFTGLIGTAGTAATATTAATAGTGLLGGGALSQAAGKVLQFAGKVVSSITKGVTSTLTEFSKTALSKLAPESALAQGAAERFFFGADSAASRVGTAIKSPFSEKALLDAATQTADEAVTSTIDASDVVETVTEKAATPDPLNPLPSIDQSLMSPSPTPPDMELLAQQKENYVEQAIRNVTTTAQETVESKLESLSDPMKVAEAGYNVFKDRRSEEELAAQQAAMSQGYVTNVGIYQDPSSFLTAEFQNTIAPIQTLQPTASYTQPMSSWSQQFMFDPFAMQQQMRTV